MKLSELPDDFTVEQFRKLDKESLDAVPYTRLRWLCQCKGCTNGTHVRDYGLGPLNERGIWALLDRNSKGINKNPHDYWMGPNNYWLCGKHNKLFKRLKSNYGYEHTWEKLIDVSKVVLITAKGGAFTTVEQIEAKQPTDRNIPLSDV